MNIKDDVPAEEEARVLREVLQLLRETRFGYIQLVVQDAKVVQIDRLEKIRLFHQPPRSGI